MKHLKIPVYNQELFIYNNYEDLERYAIVESAPLTLKYNKDTWCLSILAHECIHVVNFLLANIGQGMPYRDEHGYFDDEFYSYLYATVFDIILKKTIKDIKEFKNGPRKHRTKKVLQHSSKETVTVEAEPERMVDN